MWDWRVPIFLLLYPLKKTLCRKFTILGENYNNFDFRIIILLIISVIFFILGFLNSKFLQPLNNLWTKFGYLLGKIISPIVMFIVYFGTIFPIKILTVLFGKDLLSLKFSSKINSYWVERKNKTNLKDQF